MNKAIKEQQNNPKQPQSTQNIMPKSNCTTDEHKTTVPCDLRQPKP
jgi:hypothetical protein